MHPPLDIVFAVLSYLCGTLLVVLTVLLKGSFATRAGQSAMRYALEPDCGCGPC